MIPTDSKAAIEKVNKSLDNYLKASQQLAKDLSAANLNKTDKETLTKAMNTLHQTSVSSGKVYISILTYLATRFKQTSSGLKSGSRKHK